MSTVKTVSKGKFTLVPKIWKSRRFRIVGRDSQSSQKPEKHFSPFMKLPDDCIIDIMTIVPEVEDVISMRLTCRRLSKLSFEHSVWLSHLQAAEADCELARFSCTDYEEEASELERLVTARSRFKKRLAHAYPSPHTHVSYSRPGHIKVKKGLYKACHTLCSPREAVLTATFIPPGWLLTGSKVLNDGEPDSTKGFLRLWNTGHGDTADTLHEPLAEYPLKSSCVDGIYVERSPFESNCFLVLIGDRRRSGRWELLRLRFPDHSDNDFSFEFIEAVEAAIVNGITMSGDLIAFSCVLPTEGVLLWKWSKNIALFMQSKESSTPLSAPPDFDNGRVLITPPYIIVVNHGRSALQYYDISSAFAEPTPHPTWAHPLEIRSGASVELTPVEGGGVDIGILFPRNSRATRCAVRRRQPELDRLDNLENFGPFKCPVVSPWDYRSAYGVVGIRGGTGFLNAVEAEKVFENVLPAPHERQIDVFRSVVLDRFLGRVCVVDDNALHLFDYA